MEIMVYMALSKRMNMTEEERRKSLAEETEDVSREDQEVIFGRLGGIGMASASSEVRDVIDEAKAKGNYLKAPNGKESNLATLPNTWAQTRTIPFKDWFGNWELPFINVPIVPIDLSDRHIFNLVKKQLMLSERSCNGQKRMVC